MQLYFWPTSPYVRKVMLVALETGIDEQMELLHASPSSSGHDLQDRNPLGKIPALITEDGMALFDSPVICEYLDGLHGGDKMFPESGSARWTALRQQAQADGILDAALLRRGEEARRDDLRSKGWIAHQTAAIHRGLADLETRVDELQEPITIGHITIACALGYLDFRFPSEDWRHIAPNLSDWYAGFAQRASMQATIPADPA
ncbi:MAG: glutathione S-transferase [Rhodospirillaceae bacterium]|nr:glutathione S-transferase [Rhodospirillaceae bacterium]